MSQFSVGRSPGKLWLRAGVGVAVQCGTGFPGTSRSKTHLLCTTGSFRLCTSPGPGKLRGGCLNHRMVLSQMSKRIFTK